MGGIVMHESKVQASSLADLRSIADSPPAKPSLRRVHGPPLTLYIARVPGSKDIFLTTLKPKDKVVSAQDVESSLYYCHMESEQDELLKEEPDPDAEAGLDDAVGSETFPSSPEDVFTEQHPPPVPAHGVAAGAFGNAPSLPPRPQAAPAAVKRKPVGSTGLHPTDPQACLEEAPPQMPPRPLGPRPINGIHQTSTHHQVGQSFQDGLSDTGSRPKTPPRLPRRPVSTQAHAAYDVDAVSIQEMLRPSGRENIPLRPRTAQSSIPRSPHSFDGSWPGSATVARPSLSPRSTTSSLTRTSSLNSSLRFANDADSSKKGFNVILIRRDPATGSQTNIGKITIPPVYQRSGRPGKALLQLFNPGYEKFRAAKGTSTADLVRCISEDEDCTFSCDLRLATRRRSMKGASTPYFGDVPVNQLIAVTPSQPYSFLSPWNRVCEFSTGVSGRSLKCRHMLARGTLYDENPNDMNVVTLSELRFNTPTSTVFSRASPRRVRHAHDSSASSQISLPRKALQRISHGRSSLDSSALGTFEGAPDGSSVMIGDDQEEDWDVEPMDLTLGQEKPGGGVKGNKAKLGKLIIEAEGLEMLDLLVAANMGVWWSIR